MKYNLGDIVVYSKLRQQYFYDWLAKLEMFENKDKGMILKENKNSFKIFWFRLKIIRNFYLRADWHKKVI